MQTKKTYYSPMCEEVAFKTEGVLAASGPGLSMTPGNPFSGNTEEDWSI